MMPRRDPTMTDTFWWKPRDHCFAFAVENTCGMTAMSRHDFDKLVDGKTFADGPWVSTFGLGYGEPYRPYRQAFGKLRDGRGVFTELHRDAPDVGGGV